MQGIMGLFGQRRYGSSDSGTAAAPSAQSPQGLASLVAMLQTKQGGGDLSAAGSDGSFVHSAAGARLAASSRLDGGGLGAFAAAAAVPGNRGGPSDRGVSGSLGVVSAWHGMASHAVSPGSTTYQPQSPQRSAPPEPAAHVSDVLACLRHMPPPIFSISCLQCKKCNGNIEGGARYNCNLTVGVCVCVGGGGGGL